MLVDAGTHVSFLLLCLKLNSEALAPVFLEYYSSSDISSELSVSFIGCSFTVSEQVAACRHHDSC